MTTPATPEQIAMALGNCQPIAGGFKCRCPGHDDKKASLQINLTSPDGRPTIFCHSCGQGSEGRIYRLIEETTGLHFAGREKPSTRTKKRNRLLLPAPIPFPPGMILKGFGPPDTTWEYRDAKGGLCMVVGRWETKSGKEMRPATCVETNGQPRWTWALNGYDQRTLYGAELFKDNPDSAVLVVEGEKTADAARTLFPDYVVVTYQGGNKAWKKADWTPLRGKDVVLWPDNDPPGREAFHDLAMYLNVEGFTKSVTMAYVPNGWPAKWDLADEIPTTLDDVVFKDAPKGGRETLLSNADLSNYHEVFDGLYLLHYDGRTTHTIDKQFWVASKGIPYGLERQHTINAHHPAYRTVRTREGSGIQLWASYKQTTGDYVHGARFVPGKDMIIEEKGAKYLNTFTGFLYEPEMVGTCESFKNYILHILADGDENGFRYIWNYLSHMFQFPEDRPTVALVFKGDQGTGKSFLGRVLTELLGGMLGYGYKVQTVDAVSGKFNAHLQSKLMIWIEELEITKSRQMENRLKSLITDPVISVEAKGKDQVQQVNLARVMGSTNHEHIWNVMEGERRLSIFEVSNARIRDADYFAGIMKELRDGGFGRLMYELMNFKVDHYLVNSPYENMARSKQALLHPEPARDMAFQLLRDGYVHLRVLDERREVRHFQSVSEEEWRNGPIKISSKILRSILLTLAESPKYTESYTPRDKRCTATSVAKYLGGDGSYSTIDVMHNYSMEKDNAYKVPDLTTARQHFADQMKMPFHDLFPYEEEDSNVVSITASKKQEKAPF